MFLHKSIISLVAAILLNCCGELVWTGCPSLSEIDAVASQMVYFGNRQLLVPSDQTNLDNYCKNLANRQNTVNDFIQNCLKSEFKPAAIKLFSLEQQHYAKQCQDPAYAISFIAHNQCFINGDILEQFHQCQDKWYHKWAAMANIDVSLRVSASCCIYWEFHACISQLNSQLCHDKNDMFWKDTYEELSTDAVNQFCQGYESPTKCKENFPLEPWNTLSNPVETMDVESRKARGKYKSVFFHELDMFTQYQLQ